MVDYLPFASSAPRQPDRQRPRPIPANVKAVIHLMIWGEDAANPDALPLDLIAACAAAGVKPFVMRRYLDRPAVIAHLRAEHRKFREVVCCGNTAALRKVRNFSPNGLAVVAATRALAGMQAEEAGRVDAPTPGVVLVIRHAPAVSEPAPIDVTPQREPEPSLPMSTKPIFRMP
jgi:hypothetical protein